METFRSLIAEVDVPALDASSKEPGYFVRTIAAMPDVCVRSGEHRFTATDDLWL